MTESRITITLVSADKSKKAEVTLPASMTVADLIAECRTNWALPTPPNYVITDRTRNAQLSDKQTLADAGVADGATLEVQPLHVAGRGAQ